MWRSPSTGSVGTWRSEISEICIHASLLLCHILSLILEQRKKKRLHEGGVLDLLVDILVLIERESAREGDVDDHTGAPHVQRPEVIKILFEKNKKYIVRALCVSW